MARGKKQIEGQLSFKMCLDNTNYVVQANSLITGKQSLKLNSAKLIRAAIMQVVWEDQELKPYVITINELAKLLKVSSSNLYRDIDKLTDDILNNPVLIKTETSRKTSWIKIPWVTRCEYQSDVGIAIKLNDELKPFLINLKERYTQYTFDNINSMKSVYSIRIMEMILEKIMIKFIPKEGLNIKLSVREIREACDCEDTLERFSQLKSRVIDTAVREINELTMYSLSYTYEKEGRTIVGIVFHINTKINDAHNMYIEKSGS